MASPHSPASAPESLVVRSHGEQEAMLKHCVEALLGGAPRPVRVLEAGCGAKWAFAGFALPAHITGVDLDPEALRLRQTVSRDLDVGVVGDIRTVDLGPGRFDMVFSAYVLEHVAGASAALARFADWLEPGGVLVLLIPDGSTAKGLLTRATPFWVHVAYYRWVLGAKNAGKPGFNPYPTHYDRWVSRSGIGRFCTARGLEVVLEVMVGTDAAQFGRLGRLGVWLLKAVAALSLGRRSAGYCDIGFVIRKPVADRRVPDRP